MEERGADDACYAVDATPAMAAAGTPLTRNRERDGGGRGPRTYKFMLGRRAKRAQRNHTHPLLWPRPPRLKELLKFIFSVGIAALKTNDYYFEFETTEEEGRERS